MLKKVSIFLVGLILVGVIGFFVLMNLPKASVEAKDADYKLDAVTLFDEFNNNEAASNKKYISKVLVVTGKVESLEKDKNGAQVVIISSNDSFNGVMCTMESEENLNIKVGDTISLKGICTGKLSDVILNKCTVVSSS